VDQPFNAGGQLTKAPKFISLVTGPLDLGADGEVALDFGPGVGQGLLEAERDAPLFGLDAEDDGVDALALLKMSLGWRTFLPQAISEM
jgi:hypothetical protein